MLIYSILFLLLSNAVTLRRDKSILFNIVAIIGLIYSSLLTIVSYIMLLGFNFISLYELLVYLGAVSILFLFILMLINVRLSHIVYTVLYIKNLKTNLLKLLVEKSKNNNNITYINISMYDHLYLYVWFSSITFYPFLCFNNYILLLQNINLLFFTISFSISVYMVLYNKLFNSKYGNIYLNILQLYNFIDKYPIPFILITFIIIIISFILRYAICSSLALGNINVYQHITIIFGM